MSPSTALRVSVVVLYSFTFIASLVGNALFLYIICRKPNTRTKISFLFINMAVADLLIAIFIMPNSVAFYFRDNKWVEGVGGELLCRFQGFFFILSITASILTLVAITLDRFMAVMFPFRNNSCCGHKMCTVIIWLGSTSLMLPMLLISSSRHGDCMADWSLFKADPLLATKFLFTIFLVVLYLVPLTLMGCLYSAICYKLWRHERPGINSEEINGTARDQSRRVVTTLIIIVLVFALCWFPMHAYHMIAWAFPSQDRSPTPLYVMFLCFWAGHAHSAINPWMYISLNTKFRSAFFDIVSRRSGAISNTGSWRYTRTRTSQVNDTAM